MAQATVTWVNPSVRVTGEAIAPAEIQSTAVYRRAAPSDIPSILGTVVGAGQSLEVTLPEGVDSWLTAKTTLTDGKVSEFAVNSASVNPAPPPGNPNPPSGVDVVLL